MLYATPGLRDHAAAMSELDQYDYHLPKELIAQQPLANRIDARLLVVDRARQSIEHAYVRDLPEILRPTDCLVLNDTRVVPARLVGQRERTGAKWTGLFLAADEHGAWQILSKTRGHLSPGEAILLQAPGSGVEQRLRMLAKLDDGIWAARPEPGGDPWGILDRVGRVPLPPYIRGGEMNESDVESYQTVFADRPGSVAAPTAGLHFTPELLSRIAEKGIEQVRVTLHVGVGTFRPISAAMLDQHVMHSEWCEVSPETVEQIASARERGGRIVAVGTTSVRTLETAAESGVLQPYCGGTDLFIRPGFQFRTVDALLTNFHLPKSTLLILVRTFGGDELIQKAYADAIRVEYRFFSYGDAMLIV
jgi:S-adenosylmethionine:tRNA ribosyltransferase-isomerase